MLFIWWIDFNKRLKVGEGGRKEIVEILDGALHFWKGAYEDVGEGWERLRDLQLSFQALI